MVAIWLSVRTDEVWLYGKPACHLFIFPHFIEKGQKLIRIIMSMAARNWFYLFESWFSWFFQQTSVGKERVPKPRTLTIIARPRCSTFCAYPFKKF